MVVFKEQHKIFNLHLQLYISIYIYSDVKKSFWHLMHLWRIGFRTTLKTPSAIYRRGVTDMLCVSCIQLKTGCFSKMTKPWSASRVQDKHFGIVFLFCPNNNKKKPKMISNCLCADDAAKSFEKQSISGKIQWQNTFSPHLSKSLFLVRLFQVLFQVLSNSLKWEGEATPKSLVLCVAECHCVLRQPGWGHKWWGVWWIYSFSVTGMGLS